MSKSRTNRESSQNQQEYEPKEPPAWYKEAQRDRDLYEMLGINRDHPQGGIHKAMRKRSRVVHPDVNPEYRREAEEEFKEMQDAYEILNNPLWRSAYDAAPDHESGLDAVAILRGRNGGSRPGKARNWGQPGAAGAGAGAGGGTGGGRGTAAGAGAGAGAGGGTGGGRETGARPDTGAAGRAGDPDAGGDTNDATNEGTQNTGWGYDPRKWWQKYQQRRRGPENQDPPDFNAGTTTNETTYNEPPSPERQRANEAWANGRHGKDFVKELEDLNDRLNGDVGEKFNRLDPIHLERARATKEVYNTLFPRVKVAFDNQLFELTGLTLSQIAREMGPEGKKFEDDFILWVLRQSWEDVANPDGGGLETIIDTDKLLAQHKARLERIKRYAEPGYVKSEQAKQELFERGYGKTRWRWRDAKAAQKEIDKKHPGEAEDGWFSEVKNWRKIQEIKKNVEYAKTKAGPEAARAKEIIKRRRAEIFSELDNLNGLVTEVENPAADKEDLNPLVGFRNMFNARIKRVLEVAAPTTYDLTPAEYKARADQAETVLAQTKKVAEQLRQARLNGEDTEAFNVYKDNAGREEQELGRLTEAAIERLKEEYLSKIAHALFGTNTNRIGELPPVAEIRKYVNRLTLHLNVPPKRPNDAQKEASQALYAGAKALADKYAADTQDAEVTKLTTLDAVKTILDKLNV